MLTPLALVDLLAIAPFYLPFVSFDLRFLRLLLLGAVVAILGIGLFALPTAILGSGFLEELQKKRKAPSICPHCGKPLE